MEEVNFKDFLPVRNILRTNMVPSNGIRLSDRSWMWGNNVIKRYEYAGEPGMAYFNVDYNPKLRAIKVSKSEPGIAGSYRVKRQNSTKLGSWSSNIPKSMIRIGVVPGDYLQHPDYEDVYVLDPRTNAGTDLNISSYEQELMMLETEEAKAGDYVVWPINLNSEYKRRYPGLTRNIYAIVAKITKTVKEDGKVYADIKILSKEYRDAVQRDTALHIDATRLVLIKKGEK